MKRLTASEIFASRRMQAGHGPSEHATDVATNNPYTPSHSVGTTAPSKRRLASAAEIFASRRKQAGHG